MIPEAFSSLTAFVLPQDAEQLKAQYWTPSQAARAWNCSRATVYRLIDRYEKDLGARLIWVVRPGKTEMVRVIRANSKRPEPPRGNPAFRDGRQQSAIARAREAKRRVREE